MRALRNTFFEAIVLVLTMVFVLVGCGTQRSEHNCDAPADRSTSIDPKDLWVDKTKSTVGTT
jgi:hypothetical protein